MRVHRIVAVLVALGVVASAAYAWPPRLRGTLTSQAPPKAANKIDNLKFPTDLPPGVTPEMAERLKPIAFYTQFLGLGGTTIDSYGGVIIVGGSTRGPNGTGGTAACKMLLPENGGKLAMLVCNGHHWGKGVHSVQRGGTIQITMNDRPVHTIVADTPGLYNDYWPQEAPAGSNFYSVPEIDLKKIGVRGPWVIVKFIASGGTCTDIENVRLVPAASHE
jgi:hypothetical protein